MTERPTPEWFKLSEEVTPEIRERLSNALRKPRLPLQVKGSPAMALWFLLDSLLLANRANREGMHANALALTRQTIEALSIVELGITVHPAAATQLEKWDKDQASPGELRQWLSKNVWPSYGSGIWKESWENFMAHLARAIQPYAHYASQLAHWQERFIHRLDERGHSEFYVVQGARQYDPQKATRITLFHAILTFALARVWTAANVGADKHFEALVNRFRLALGKSKYLDGHQTNWEHQFWAAVWSKKGGTILE
jgi:hypothetical protein